MTLVINRLKEEGFEALAEADNLLQDESLEKIIKDYKEELQIEENVKPFELLYYGSLIKKGKEINFKDEMRKDYGFVQYRCHECDRWLTEDEYRVIKTKTDADAEYYCGDHLSIHFKNKCSNCGILTSSKLCKNCEVEVNRF